MKLRSKRLNLLASAVAAAAFLMPLAAKADLIGSQLSVSGILQATASSTPQASAVLTTATVSATTVEFPMIGRLTTNLPGYFLVNTDIDAGANYLDISFTNAGSGVFANTFRNTYVFTFARSVLDAIVSATIDTPLTTLGVSNTNLSFSGDQLSLNVSGVSYNPRSFVRIDLAVQSSQGGGTTPPSTGGGSGTSVPEPTTAALLLVGLLSITSTRLRGWLA